MSPFAPVRTPLLTFAFAAGGFLLAWLWFNVGAWLPAVVVLLAWVASVAIQAVGERRITTAPLEALRILEWRLLGVAAVSAGLAAVVIVATVTITAGQESTTDPAAKELIGSFGAALTTFIAAMALTGESSDERIGTMVRDLVRERFVTGRTPEPGQVEIDLTNPAGDRADKAVNSSSDFGWFDWSKDTRHKRMEALDLYVRSTRGGQSAETQATS